MTPDTTLPSGKGVTYVRISLCLLAASYLIKLKGLTGLNGNVEIYAGSYAGGRRRLYAALANLAAL
ncbi:hypothetical protein GCM10007905_03820 [Mixta theicola]|nr:hypothetical protein GCM10007905_03820 [Mixta theicola]